MKTLFLTLFVMTTLFLTCQGQISGTISGKNSSGEVLLLPMANIFWSNYKLGVSSDMNGKFSIAEPPADISIIISYIGYKDDTIKSFDKKHYNVVLAESATLTQFEIIEKSSNSHIDKMNPIWNQQIGSGELQRAACCNLSESFETNASVDVNFTDAVSGVKQIQLLGLSGIYSQLLAENIPFMRGLGASFGLEYIPGTWMSSISISKGNSAVINGYESITGQINAEFKKPEEKEKLFFNYYLNDAGRHEFNTNVSSDINKRLSTILLGHYSFNNLKIDHNKDGFMDMNLGNQINIANFWQYINPNGLEMRWGIRALDDSREGGQISGSPYFKASPEGLWKSKIRNRRAEAFLKTGYVFKKTQGTSVGFINSTSFHDLDMFFGNKKYYGYQKSYYSNFIFHSNLKNPKHSYDAGFNLIYDNVTEKICDSTFITNEFVVGPFFQYTFTLPDKLTIMAGVRQDYNSRFKWLFTPRIHGKYHINKKTTLRASIGIGYRSPYIIAENISVLTSARQLKFLSKPELEKALNFGMNFVKYFDLFGKDLMLSLEYFKTDFFNQMLIDMESDTSNIYAFSLNGKSYSHNAQIEISYPILKYLDITAAIRYNDVRQTLLSGKLEEKPLISNFKGLLTMSFTSNMRRWQMDVTSQFVGKSRLPDRSAFPQQYKIEEYSPAHFLLFAQIARNFKHWTIYIGAENLTNYIQKKPIISALQPYSQYFDSSVIWGPVMGRKIYAGIKIKLNKKRTI